MEQFIMKTKVYLGEASLETLRDMGIKKAFVICDPFMKSSHKVDMVTDLLEEAGAEFSVFAEVVPDPTIAVVSKAIEQMLVCRPDAVIALGGGSSIDTAKAAGLLYSGMSQSERPELIAIPTTSGTGSEVTSFAVISDPENRRNILWWTIPWCRIRRCWTRVLPFRYHPILRRIPAWMC